MIAYPLKSEVHMNREYDEEKTLIPLEQQTLTFYGKPIVVVRLSDGRPAVVLRFLCDNLEIDTNAQVMISTRHSTFLGTRTFLSPIGSRWSDGSRSK
jgi:hypothetical protein